MLRPDQDVVYERGIYFTKIASYQINVVHIKVMSLIIFIITGSPDYIINTSQVHSLYLEELLLFSYH